MTAPDAPALAGIRHLKLPVTDLGRSLQWYRTRLGHELELDFAGQHPHARPVITTRPALCTS